MKKRLNTVIGLWVIIVALSILAFNVSSFLVSSDSGIPNDFFTFYLASRMISDGDDPYDPSSWVEGHKEYSVDFVANDTFLYPLPLAIFLSPLSLLSLWDAYRFWFLVSIISLITSLVLLIRSEFKSLPISRTIPLLVGIFLFRGTITSLLFGQISPFLLLLIATSLYLVSINNWLLASVTLSTLVLKPNIGGPFLAILAVLFFIYQNWKALLGLLAGSLTIFLIGSIYSPNWIYNFIQISLAKGSRNLGFAPTLWGVSGALCSRKEECALVLGAFFSLFIIAFVISLFLRSKSNIANPSLISISLCSATIVTPYLWSYDHVLILAPLILAILRMDKRGIPYWITFSVPFVFDLFALLLIFIALRVGNDIWSVLIPASVLGMLVFQLFRSVLLPDRLVAA